MIGEIPRLTREDGHEDKISRLSCEDGHEDDTIPNGSTTGNCSQFKEELEIILQTVSDKEFEIAK